MRFIIKFLLLWVLSLLCWSSLSQTCAAFQPASLRVGFDDTSGTFWQDKHLLYHGAAFEYTEAIATYLGVRTSYTRGSLEDNLLRLHAGSLDLLYLPDAPIIPGSPGIPAQQPPHTLAIPLGQCFGWLLVDDMRPDLQAALNNALRELQSTSPLYPYKLLEKYHIEGNNLELTDAEKAYLAAHPVLRVMISPRQPPYAYFLDGQPQGVIADIIQRIEADLGITLEVIPEDTQTQMMQHLTAGEVDMVMDFYTDHNWAKAHNAVLTFPYLTLNYVSVLRRDQPLPEKPIIACARTHFYTQDYIEKHFPPEQLRYYTDVAECMAAVNGGEADMTFVKSITAQSDIYQGNYYNLYTNGNVVFSHHVSMAVNKQMDPMLVKILDKEIAHITPQEISSIINRHVYGVHSQESLQAIIYRNPLLALSVLGGVLLLIIIGLLYVLRLRRNYTAELWQQANVVPSAGLFNLHWFANSLPSTIAKYGTARQKGELFVIALSPQRVAFIKELYGTKGFAQALKDTVTDIQRKLPWILLFGISGEITHAFLLCKKPAGMTIRQAAERIQRTARIIVINGVPTSFSYYLGICPVPRTWDLDPALLMDNAMMAHNEIIGHNKTIGLFNTNMHDEMLQQQQMELYMEKALAEKEFQVFLQAKYDLQTQEICGAEALVRWQSPELGFLTPNSFINLFERNGFALKLDYYMLEIICQQLQQRLQQKLPVVPVSVNQTGLHITERGYLANMQAIAERYQLPRKLVELELTETAFIDFTTKTENENALQITRRLKSLGFALSMDDFCTGYSSIAMLRHLPMDIMKVDRSMLIAAEKHARCHTILKQIIEMGRSLNMTVLVEGIETTAQENMLREIGCHIGQGYLFAHPIPAEQFWDKLTSNPPADLQFKP